jgi:hypothetical protein
MTTSHESLDHAVALLRDRDRLRAEGKPMPSNETFCRMLLDALTQSETGNMTEPDKNCITTPDGGCIGGPCMHDPEYSCAGSEIERIPEISASGNHPVKMFVGQHREWLRVFIDHSLPEGTIELRDTVTGRVMGRIINVGE